MPVKTQTLEGTIAETYVKEGHTRAKVLLKAQLIDVDIAADADLHLGDTISVDISISDGIKKPRIDD